MSHELRTPLNAILGFAPALWTGGRTPPAISRGELRGMGKHLKGGVISWIDQRGWVARHLPYRKKAEGKLRPVARTGVVVRTVGVCGRWT